MPVSKRLRYEILRRDNHACRYCGAQAPDVALVVDHVIPVTLGGTDEPSNLAAACRPCNTGKTSTSPDAPLVSDVAQDALRWSRAMAMAADFQEQRQRALDCYIETFDISWSTWTYGTGKKRKPVPRPDNWQDSLRRFFALGLSIPDVERFIRIAMEHVRHDEVFRYFCGCCWKHLRERQDIARDIFAAQEVDDAP